MVTGYSVMGSTFVTTQVVAWLSKYSLVEETPDATRLLNGDTCNLLSVYGRRVLLLNAK